MLGHECEFVPASFLDRACLVTLSSSSQDFTREKGGQSRLCSRVKL